MLKEFNKLIVDEMFDKLQPTKQRGCHLEDIADYVIGDIIGFAEAIANKEKEDPNYFTKEYDRDVELPILFRESVKDFDNLQVGCCYSDFLSEWLDDYNTAIQANRNKHIEFIEVCPHCGQEIDIFLSQNSKVIPFCPHCGAKEILLCSECHEFTNCDRNDPRAFCYGKKEV